MTYSVEVRDQNSNELLELTVCLSSLEEANQVAARRKDAWTSNAASVNVTVEAS